MTVPAGGPVPAPVVPADWRLALDAGLQRRDGGRVLIGGYPTRILRLSPAGARTVERWSGGEAVGGAPAGGRLARRLVDAGAAHPLPAPGAGRGISWSLVVPTSGRPEELATLLATAVEPGFAGPGSGARPDQVVVVDDASADPRAVAAVAGRYGAELIRHDRRRGPAAARNSGWRATRTGAVAFLDDDCRCPEGPGWADRLRDHLADPAVGLVAPRVRSRRGRAPGWLAAYEQAASPLDLGVQPAPIRRGGPVPYVPAAALLVRRAALEEVGGFDESLPVGEDVELVWRRGEAGWGLRYEPAVEVAHDVRPDTAAWMRQRFGYGTSAVALDDRRPRSVAPLQCSAWTAAALTLAGTTTPAGLGLAGAVAAGSVAALVPRLRSVPSPARTAAQLSVQGHRWAARALVRAARREWWPLLVAGLWFRRGRRIGILVAAATAGPALRRRSRPAGIGAARYLALSVLDGLAYGSGLWFEALRRRRFGALAPSFGNGPTGPSPKGDQDATGD